MAMKRIVLCADGTWDGTSNNTNVYKLFNSMAVSPTQIPFYDSGVGASGLPLDRVLGGAFGTGLFQKVKDGYTKIAHVYKAGDEIFIFGFSRGAYTARSVAGMISACGLPTANFDVQLVETAFDAYRRKDLRLALLAELKTYQMVDAPISMLGVWDTVGSLGIPAIFGGVSPLIYGFLDTGLHPNVSHAYHALAIDERRAEFPPTLWTSEPTAQQVIEQVWFAGAHSDVGGGYAASDVDSGSTLSDVTLGWMMGKAAALELEFAPESTASFVPIQPKLAFDCVHDSWNPLWGFFRRRDIPCNSYLSQSAVDRYTHDPNYRPSNLTRTAGVWSPSCREYPLPLAPQ
jgi:uncharacterized protein (DUF2235 family)